MKKVNKKLAFLMLSMIGGLWSANAMACTTISSVPTTISSSGTYCFTSDLEFESGTSWAAITITTSQVAIDLQGHILNNSPNNTGNKTGITVSGSTLEDIKIVNGSIQNFYKGIQVLGKNLTVQDMIVTADSSSNTGIYVDTAENAHILNNQVTAGYGIYLTDVFNTHVVNNSITGAVYGIFGAFSDVTVRDNTITSIDYSGQSTVYGVYYNGTGGVVDNNIIQNLNGKGLYMYNGSGAVYRNNTVVSSLTAYTGGTNGGGNYPTP